MNQIQALVLQGDNIEIMRQMPSNSVDSVVTDPPYGLSEHRLEDVIECLLAWLRGEEYRPNKKGFMGRSWDAWVPGPEVWREVLRVLKPGGHVLAFAGTRSMDLMSLAIRLAGFELRDSIGHAHDNDGAPLLAWIYGSGFPKNMDVAAAIDQKIMRDWLNAHRPQALRFFNRLWAADRDAPFKGQVPWEVRWILRMEKRIGGPIPGKRRVVDQVPQGGAKFKLAQETIDNGGFNDPARASYAVTAPGSSEAAEWDGFGTALKPGWEPIILARKPLEGTVAANVLKYGTGGLNIEACRIGSDVLAAQVAGQAQIGTFEREAMVTPERIGRWPANVVFSHLSACTDDGCAMGCPARILDSQSGVSKSRPGKPRSGVSGDGWSMKATGAEYSDAGGASRYFYCPKPSRSEKEAGLRDEEIELEVTWENEALRVRLLVAWDTSLPKVISASTTLPNDATEWNTWLFGSDTMALFQAASKSIIETKTSKTTESRIWNYLTRSRTSDSTAVASCEATDGGSLAVNAAQSSESISFTSAKTVSLPHARTVPSGARWTISANAVFTPEKVNDGRNTPIDNPYQRGETDRLNSHMTVKPVELIRYFARLITPPGGILLDPFFGSGSHGVAAIEEGFSVIGIEQKASFCHIAHKRTLSALERKRAASICNE